MFQFSDKALILFPKESIYDSRYDNYKYNFNVSVSNLLTYFALIGVTPYGIYTDDLMRKLRPEGVQLINILSVSDTYFAYKYCDNMSDALTIPKWDDVKALAKITADSANDTELSPMDRFDKILKHEKKASQVFIKSYKLVVIFNFPNKNNYKAISKPNDENIRLYANASTFEVEAFISGTKVPATDLLGFSSGNFPMYMWDLNDLELK